MLDALFVSTGFGVVFGGVFAVLFLGVGRGAAGLGLGGVGFGGESTGLGGIGFSGAIATREEDGVAVVVAADGLRAMVLTTTERFFEEAKEGREGPMVVNAMAAI